jgi:hypothetical protein
MVRFSVAQAFTPGVRKSLAIKAPLMGLFKLIHLSYPGVNAWAIEVPLGHYPGSAGNGSKKKAATSSPVTAWLTIFGRLEARWCPHRALWTSTFSTSE